MLVLCLVAACLPGSVSSVTKAPGENVTLEVRQAGTQASTTLKWELVFPAQSMALEGDKPEAGSAATASGKELQCNLTKPYIYACILFGGVKPLSNGPLAIFRFKIAAAAAPAKTSFRLQRSEAAGADSKFIVLNDAEATVTIH